jgi:type I restriction enzyme, S subunit
MIVREMKLVKVGECIGPIRTWNPAQDSEDETFRYIDISSVSQEEKKVILNGEIPIAEAPSRARQLVQTGDVLVSTVRPNLNAVAFVPKEMDGATASTGFCVLRPTQSRLDGRYLFHWVRTAGFVAEMTRKASGQSYPAVSDKVIKESFLPLPPLEEQKRIGSILDQADELRQKRRTTLERLDVLTHAIFSKAFGDPVLNTKNWPIVDVGSVTSSIVPGRDKPKSFSGNIPWITTSELVHLGETGSRQAKAGLTDGEIRQVRARVIPVRSVILTCVGDLGVVSIAGEPIVINQQLHAYQCSNEIMPEYLMYALSYQVNYMRRMATATTLPYMNKSVCNGIPIQLPPLSAQKIFGAHYKALMEVRLTLSKSLGHFDSLFASLQHRAFTGELTSKDAERELAIGGA